MTNLKQKRQSLGLLQMYVAKQVGISPQLLTRYESGETKPNLENAIKIALFFKCETIEELKELFEIK